MAIKYRIFPIVSEQDAARFWSLVKQGAPDECWLWQGSTIPLRGNYGRFYIHRIAYRTNRLAYYLANGVDPGELDVCHRCDNPPCCNPEHLFAGTRADNHKDMDKKNRRARGEDRGCAKLTQSVVKAIRRRYYQGNVAQHVLADEYGVSTSLIGHVVNFKTWRHVEQGSALPALPPPNMRRARGEGCYHARLTADDVRLIRNLWASGHYNQSEIARQLNVRHNIVWNVINGKTWKHVA